jgi:prepilin-type N-terminal cleavage/methylation domain-containing protein
MKARRIAKRALTLIEMLIVIALIGIIGSALAYNLGAGLNKGKEFKSEQHRKKIRHILEYEMADKNLSPEEATQNWQAIVRESSLLDRDQRPEDLFKDGNGAPFEVSYDQERQEIIVKSSK